MRFLSLIKHHTLGMRPTLKAHNPRIGTCIIPLSQGDEDIFYQYLNNKVHSLSFEGTPTQLKKMIERLQVREGLKVQKMRISSGHMFLHLVTPAQQELRRVIKLL